MTPAKESAPPPAPSSDSGEDGSPAEPGSSDDVPWPRPEIHTRGQTQPAQVPAGIDVAIQNPSGFAEVREEAFLPWAEQVVETLLLEAAVLEDAALEDGAAVSLTLRFVDDGEIAELNAAYRHKDGPTDVLTFPGDLPAAEAARASWQETPAGFETQGDGEATFPGEGSHLGDVVISVPTARRQAEARGHDVERELRILGLHGVLHALGYDHEVDDGTMEQTEDELHRRFLEADR